MTVPRGQGKNDRYFPSYDDQLGITGTALVGNAQWTLDTYRDASVVMPMLRHDQDDFVYMIFQFTHRRQLGTALASVHAHIIPCAAPAALHTDVYWAWAYTWKSITEEIPVIGSWTAGNTTTTLLTTDQWKHIYAPIVLNIAAPAGETDSSCLLVKMTRMGSNVLDTFDINKGTGTLQANLAILYLDCHTLVHKDGSDEELVNH